MPFMEQIRGNKARNLLIKNYNVSCTGHFDVLNDEHDLQCCCHDPLGDEYFRFTAQSKTDPDETHVFYAGPSCGRKINLLINVLAPEKIGLFVAEKSASRHLAVPGSADTKSAEAMSKINAEVKQVCFLVQQLLGRRFRKALDGLLARTQEKPTRIPTDNELRFINELAGELAKTISDAEGNPCSTLRLAIAVRATRPGRRLRVFNFTEIETRLTQIGGGIQSML